MKADIKMRFCGSCGFFELPATYDGEQEQIIAIVLGWADPVEL